MRELPKPLQVYRHFKGSYYQILGVARHSETGEELVIYRSLFDPEEIYARPLEMFLSETDKDKYPNARQKYRFTLADGGYNKKDRKSQAGEKDKGEAAPKSAEE
ncbi:MAG: DUF1653 domain-containing protein, partial [Lachnospiraceae bacterium]|nr:DUF1653 domain-containing protein [Lachnospiraceae bacterium]